MPEPLVIVMAVFAVLGVVLLVAALATLRKRRWLGTGMSMMLAGFFLALAALAATLGIAMQGYRALTREVVAATVVTRPTGPERFLATFTFPEGRREQYEITGNALYVDADRKSTRLNSSHVRISYAVFCLKKKKTDTRLQADRPGAT